MAQQTIKQGLNAFNLLLVATFLVLALYSALGQQVFPLVGQYRAALEDYLSEKLRYPVEIRSLSGDMKVFTPSIHGEGIRVGSEDNVAVSIAAVDAVLDPRRSLLNLTPVFKSVRLSGLSVRLDKNLPAADSSNALENNADAIRRFVTSLLLQQKLELNNVDIEFWREGEQQNIRLDHLTMTGDGFSRLMTGNVIYDSGQTIKTGFRLYTQGSPYLLDEFYARGQLELPQLDVNYWIKELLQLDIFESFQASSQLNFEFKNGLLNYARLKAASPSVAINKDKQFDQVTTELWLKQNNVDTWSLWLKEGKFTLNNLDWRLDDVAIKVSRTLQGNRWQGFVKSMDLEYLQGLLSALNVVPEKTKQLLSDLDASGKLENFSVILQQESQSKPHFTVAGELDNVSVNRYLGIPKLQNVSGVLAANKHSGRIQLDSQNLVLNLENVYDHGFDVEQANGQIDWFIGEHETHVAATGLDLQVKDIGNVSGGFQIWAPKTLLKSTLLELNLGFEQADLLSNQLLIPKNAVPALKTWLGEHIRYGQISTGNLYTFSELSKTSGSTHFQMYLDLENSALNYQTNWPDIENAGGDLFIDNSLVMADIESAITLGGDVSQMQVLYDADVLWINGAVVGDARGMFSYFQTTPLQEIVKGQFDDWILEGRHYSDLAFRIPFSDEPLTAEIQTGLQRSLLLLEPAGLSFDYINGGLHYSSSKGLSSDRLTANFWQRPFNIDIDSTIYNQTDKQDFKTQVSFTGTLESKALKNWLRLPLLASLSGGTGLNGEFVIDSRENEFTGLKIQSDLKGIGIALPKPYGKQSQSPSSFNLTTEFENGQQVKIQYSDQIQLAMNLKDGQLIYGQLDSLPIQKKSIVGADGSTTEPKTNSAVTSKSGFHIDLATDNIVVEDWLNVWNQIKKEEEVYPDSSGKNPLKVVSLSTKKITYDGKTYKDVDLDLSINEARWSFDVASPLAKGLVHWHPNGAEPTKLDLDYIHWPAIEENESNTEDRNTDPLAWLKPKDIPPLALNVDEIFVGPTNYGRWTFDVQPYEQGVYLNNIDGDIKKLNVKGQLHWFKPNVKNAPSKQLETTSIDLKLASNDLAGIQAAWRSRPAVEAERTRFDLKLNWPNSPAEFDIKKANGDLAANLKDGRFLEAGDASALNAFGILNFAAIGRRLRLDFTDVYESGLHFDSVKGKAKINDGIITIVDTLNIEGPSANFAASGTVNTINKQLDQELSVTFPVTSTLPFVAILAGFAPPVAASLFVGERLVGDEIERFTSATYQLSGTWDEPSLKLKKRFDNEIEGKKDKTFWHRMKDVFGVGDD